MNITLSVDEQVAQRAREAAQKMGKSLIALVAENGAKLYIEFSSGANRPAGLRREFREMAINLRGYYTTQGTAR